MKLLWVKAGGLLPPDTGGKIRSFHILKQLARKHDITLFTFYPEHPGDLHPAGSDIFSKVVAVPLPLPPRRSIGEYARSARLLMTGRPFTVYKFFYPEVYRRYAELLQSSEFDLIVCDFLVPAPLIDWKTPPPKILFTHNVEAEVWARHAKVAVANPLDETGMPARIERIAACRAPLRPTGGLRSGRLGKQPRRFRPVCRSWSYLGDSHRRGHRIFHAHARAGAAGHHGVYRQHGLEAEREDGGGLLCGEDPAPDPGTRFPKRCSGPLAASRPAASQALGIRSMWW